MTRGKYQLSYADENPYGRAVSIVAGSGVEPGLILDLGAGYGAPAEPLAERGYTYVAGDVDVEALKDVAHRGFETHAIDLNHEDLTARIREVVAGRRVSALLMLDSLEHTDDWVHVLDSVTKAAECLGRPLLVASVPNVAHFDIAAKLVVGRFDTTQTGLLDATHRHFFTGRRLEQAMGERGWAQFAQADLVLRRSDQHFPPSYPTLREGAPVHDHLKDVRTRADDHAFVNQFIRGYTLTTVTAQPPEAAPAADSVFATVLLRTQGTRNFMLLEALTCLAAQTEGSTEIILLVHTTRTEVVDEVRELCEMFHWSFRSRLRVLPVTEGGRATPLNVGLDSARGRYIAFLDDDDLVTADWMEAFQTAAEDADGAVLRSVTVDQEIVKTARRSLAPYVPTSGLVRKHAARFDFVQHLYMNQTPICSVAYPREMLQVFNLRFDETLDVLEDWHLLLEMARLCGVHDTARTTSIYHRWEGADSSWGAIDPRIWDGIRLSILRRLDAGPLLLPAGSATTIAVLQEDLARVTSPLNHQESGWRRKLLLTARRFAPLWAIKLRRRLRAYRVASSLRR